VPRLPGVRNGVSVGVQYGKLIEPFRIHLNQTGASKENLGWLQRLLLYRFHSLRPAHALGPWLQPGSCNGRASMGYAEDRHVETCCPNRCGRSTTCCRRSSRTMAACRNCCRPRAPGGPAWPCSPAVAADAMFPETTQAHRLGPAKERCDCVDTAAARSAAAPCITTPPRKKPAQGVWPGELPGLLP